MNNTYEEDSFSALEELGETIDFEQNKKETEEEYNYSPAQQRLHPLFLEMISHKIPCSMDINSGIFKISGFYKNGPMNIEETKEGELIAIDKRGNETFIHSIDDLVFLNFQHWKAAGGKNKVYPKIDKPWELAFQNKGLIQKIVSFTPAD